MGRLTRSGLHLPLLSPFVFEPVFADGARIVVVDMANWTKQIQIKLPSSWRALNFPRQNSDGLSRVRLSFCRGTLSKPRYTLMKTTRYFWLSPPRSHVLLIGRKRARTDWPITVQPMTLLINEPLVALLMSNRLTGRQPMWQAVGALVKGGGSRRFDSEIWPACRQISVVWCTRQLVQLSPNHPSPRKWTVICPNMEISWKLAGAEMKLDRLTATVTNCTCASHLISVHSPLCAACYPGNPRPN